MNQNNKFREFRIDLLKKEIDMINQKVNHFDNLRQKTKQMGILLWTATIGYGLKENIQVLFYISALLPLPFWLMETSFRRYYRGFYARFRAIAEFIRNGNYNLKGTEVTLAQFLSEDENSDFPIFDYWGIETIPSEKHRKETGFLNSFIDRNLLLVYGPMMLISIVLIISKIQKFSFF